MRPKRILFPTDFSPCSEEALAHAVALAGRYAAEIHLIHVMMPFDADPHGPGRQFPDAAAIQERIRESRAGMMRELISSTSLRDLAIRQTLLRGVAAAPTILEYARNHHIDLIVMGTHGRRGLGHLFLGSVAEEVVRFSSCPVLTVRASEENRRRVFGITRILVPVDFSEHSKAAVRYGKYLAADYDAKLTLLHIVEEVTHPSFYVSGRAALVERYPDLFERAEGELRKIVREAEGPEREAECIVIEGRASGDIVRYAEEHDIDLIAIATQGLTGLEHFLIGSVTEKVVRMARCPVLTVHARPQTVESAATAADPLTQSSNRG